MTSTVVQKRYRLVCTLSSWELIRSAISWMIAIPLTLGLALPFCVFHFFQILINSTELQELGEAGPRTRLADDQPSETLPPSRASPEPQDDKMPAPRLVTPKAQV